MSGFSTEALLKEAQAPILRSFTERDLLQCWGALWRVGSHQLLWPSGKVGGPSPRGDSVDDNLDELAPILGMIGVILVTIVVLLHL